MNNKKIKSFIFLILILNTANLFSQEKNFEKGKELNQKPITRKHLGFFFRAQYGLAAANISTYDDIDGSIGYISEFSRTYFFNMMVGKSIINNLILYAGISNLSSRAVHRPQISNSKCGLKKDIYVELTTFCYGIYNISSVSFGVTYYFMPINIFISSDIRYSIGDLQSDSYDATYSYVYKHGRGVSFQIGKEWYVDNYSGLGIALQYDWIFLESEAIKGREKGTAVSELFGVLFTSTYN